MFANSLRALALFVAIFVGCTETDDEAEIASLRTQVQELQRQLDAGSGSRTIAPATSTAANLTPSFSPAVKDAATRIEVLLEVARFTIIFHTQIKDLDVQRGSSGPLITGPDIPDARSVAVAAGRLCEGIPSRDSGILRVYEYREPASLGYHLWPMEYAAIDRAVQYACFAFQTSASLSDQLRIDFFVANAIIDDGAIERLLMVLPDYSPAQLRRALAERE